MPEISTSLAEEAPISAPGTCKVPDAASSVRIDAEVPQECYCYLEELAYELFRTIGCYQKSLSTYYELKLRLGHDLGRLVAEIQRLKLLPNASRGQNKPGG
ncbi:hypothetical protein [Hyphomicrobium sp. LHD-15]|uniref:hypothetical protein n=1 Tax=Hyphomicrobium sp. LHD-15 TaxID=3072142 RepID=UPI00280E6808|nr:hypothetical protein [Hyphomicrobium sp. LHD-15]MDQ8699257.1 hypothetical protein [Hyphomicrobium sp. LHD-15]